MFELWARSSALGGRIELRLEQQEALAELPRVVLVRRRGAYPSHVDDGLSLFDTQDLFDAGGAVWARREHWRFVLTNAPKEGGLCQLDLALFFSLGAAPDATSYARARFWDAGAEVEQVIIGVVAVDRRLGATPGDTSELRLVDAAGVELASLSWSPSAAEPGTATWRYPSASASPVVIPYHLPFVDRLEARQESLSGETRTTFAWAREGQRAPQLTLRIAERTSADTGVHARTFELVDRLPPVPKAAPTELQPEQHYYYQGFAEQDGDLTPSPALAATAPATARYGFADDPDQVVADEHRLYELLPAVVRRVDEPDASDQNLGPLRKFVAPFGVAFDELRSRAEVLRHRHDLGQLRADLLPRLARYIGWDLDVAQSALGQRLDIAFAPELYRSVGTLPNLKALITRASGLDVRFKEFVHNVAFTNAPESPRLWELWQRQHTGGTWSSDQPLTTTTRFHGRPALAFDTRGQLWVFGHLENEGTWSVFAQRIDPSPGPLQILASDVSEMDPAVVATATSGEIFLFSSIQRRDGGMDLQARRLRLTDAGAVVLPRTDDPALDAYRLTDHKATDRLPTAVRAGADIWLFWQSSRSGKRAIWGRRLVGDDPLAWSTDPERLTDGEHRDETPSAAYDGATGSLYLAWSRDYGDHAWLCWQMHDGSAWQPVEVERPSTPAPPPYRDRAPALVSLATGVHVCWHSDRPHPVYADAKRLWRIWRMRLGDAPSTELLVDGNVGNQEPVVAVAPDGSERLVFRSERRGAELYWTRTVDTSNAALLADLGTFDDLAHYTYDTEIEDSDWFAGNAVGLFFTSSTATSAEVRERVQRMKHFVEPFRPEHVRLVWIVPFTVIDIDISVGATDRFTDRVINP